MIYSMTSNFYTTSIPGWPFWWFHWFHSISIDLHSMICSIHIHSTTPFVFPDLLSMLSLLFILVKVPFQHDPTSTDCSLIRFAYIFSFGDYSIHSFFHLPFPLPFHSYRCIWCHFHSTIPRRLLFFIPMPFRFCPFCSSHYFRFVRHSFVRHSTFHSDSTASTSTFDTIRLSIQLTMTIIPNSMIPVDI